MKDVWGVKSQMEMFNNRIFYALNVRFLHVMLTYTIVFIIYRKGSGIYKLSFSWSFLHQILYMKIRFSQFQNCNSFSVTMNRYLIWFEAKDLWGDESQMEMFNNRMRWMICEVPSHKYFSEINSQRGWCYNISTYPSFSCLFPGSRTAAFQR